MMTAFFQDQLVITIMRKEITMVCLMKKIIYEIVLIIQRRISITIVKWKMAIGQCNCVMIIMSTLSPAVDTLSLTVKMYIQF